MLICMYKTTTTFLQIHMKMFPAQCLFYSNSYALL